MLLICEIGKHSAIGSDAQFEITEESRKTSCQMSFHVKNTTTTELYCLCSLTLWKNFLRMLIFRSSWASCLHGVYVVKQSDSHNWVPIKLPIIIFKTSKKYEQTVKAGSPAWFSCALWGFITFRLKHNLFGKGGCILRGEWFRILSLISVMRWWWWWLWWYDSMRLLH